MTDIRPSGLSAWSRRHTCEPHELSACSLPPPNCSFLPLPFFLWHSYKDKNTYQRMWGKFKANMEDWISYEGMCVCVCVVCGGWRGYVYVYSLKSERLHSQHIHTLNSMSEALLWCMNQGPVQGCGAELGPVLIGLSHDQEGCMIPSEWSLIAAL